jgi:hypothetical protein
MGFAEGHNTWSVAAVRFLRLLTTIIMANGAIFEALLKPTIVRSRGSRRQRLYTDKTFYIRNKHEVMPQCGVSTANGTPCQRRTDGGPCFMHDESGPPSSHGGQPGNKNAVGNSGGGAPPLNANAVIHAGFSDPEKHYQRLEGEAKEWVDDLADSITEQSKAGFSPEETKRLARRIATLHHQWDCAAVDTLERGWVIEREETHEPAGKTYTVNRLNPALRAGRSMSRRKYRLYRTLRTYSIPDGRPWSEW